MNYSIKFYSFSKLLKLLAKYLISFKKNEVFICCFLPKFSDLSS
ncbi:hypothetical protein EU91_0524 [Prochlorococcus marinus str. GP2]|uniref:Uncharacterized protein n=1 Tax=Prochlorococcus marinus str. GP2 TaxID=59925 RepID=A0A0A1ZGS0_PROMR|nr:hypothetical protein EU91_0524 [Prochlorococcus marinus str. GP2]